MRLRHLRIPAGVVLAAFAILSIERFARGDLLQRLDQNFTRLDLAYLITVLALPLAVAITIKRLRNSRFLAEHFFGISITMALMLGAVFGYVAWDNQQPAATAIVVAATLATVGWLTQQAHSEALQRKQHTLNVLVQMRQSDVFNKHKNHLLSRYPHGTVINEKDVDELWRERTDASKYGKDEFGYDKYPLAESILYIANFYEFLASGVKAGDIDKQLLRESLRTIIDKFYLKVEPMLRREQKPDSTGKPTTKVFNNYYDLIKSWDD